MSNFDILKTLSCNFERSKKKIISKSIADVALSAKFDGKLECERQLLQAILSLAYATTSFAYLVKKLESIFEVEFNPHSTVGSDYIASLLIASKSTLKSTCIRRLIQTTPSYLNVCPEFDNTRVSEQLTKASSDNDLIKKITLLVGCLEDEDAYALRMALEFDLSVRAHRELICSEIVSLTNSDYINTCFNYIDKFPELANEILFAVCYTTLNPKEDGRDILEELTGVIASGSLVSHNGWVAPNSLKRIRETVVFFQVDKEPSRDFGDKTLNEHWEKIVKDAELFQEEEKVEEQMTRLLGNQKSGQKTPPKTSRQGATTMRGTTDNINQKVWNMLTIEERERWGNNSLRFSIEIQALGDKINDDPSLSAIVKYFEEARSDKKKSSSSAKKSASAKYDEIPEESPEVVVFDQKPTDFQSGSSVYAYLNFSDGIYAGHVISNPNIQYHEYFNWIKKLFGFECVNCKIVKIPGKFTMETPEGLPSNTPKVLCYSDEVNKGKEAEKRTFSIWFCYKDDPHPNVLKLDTFTGEGAEKIQYSAIKLSILRWLFGFAGTNLESLYYFQHGKDYKIVSFWECVPKKGDACLKNLMKSMEAASIVEKMYIDIVDEIVKVLETNKKEIYDRLNKTPNGSNIENSLNGKILPKFQDDNDRRSPTAVICDFIKSEIVAEKLELARKAEQPPAPNRKPKRT